ncbi:hypothetical protein HY641_01735 [Candidatus Woesearchaeota archaeon]|nr:hypothetical protein [Candidatus Woesearchaeota archaeon]
MAKGPKVIPRNSVDVGTMLLGAMVVVALVIGVIFMYGFEQPTPKTRTFSNLSGEVSLRISNITVEPFTPPEVWSFKDVYVAVRHLDKKYETSGADFHNENLRSGPMVHPNAADDYLRDVDKLEAWIGNNTFKNQSNAIGHFLEARRKMLISEKSFQQALSYGMHGVFNKELNCEDREIIKQATKLYNTSQINGWRAMAQLDKAMAADPIARDLIGVNTPTEERRPKFYDNIFVDIAYLANNNLVGLEEYCEGTKPEKSIDPIVAGNFRGMAS